jgi:hypothetical protein
VAAARPKLRADLLLCRPFGSSDVWFAVGGHLPTAGAFGTAIRPAEAEATQVLPDEEIVEEFPPE